MMNMPVQMPPQHPPAQMQGPPPVQQMPPIQPQVNLDNISKAKQLLPVLRDSLGVRSKIIYEFRSENIINFLI